VSRWLFPVNSSAKKSRYTGTIIMPIYSKLMTKIFVCRVGKNISRLYVNAQMDMPSMAQANGETATAGLLRQAYNPSHAYGTAAIRYIKATYR
jgi:hypothetical protein